MDTWLQLHRRPQLCSIYNHLSGLLNSFTFLLFLFSWWERDRERLIFDFQIKMEDWIYINMFVPIQNFIIRVNWFFKTSSPPRTFFHCFLRERERERERERKGERNIDEKERHQLVASCMYPDGESNPQPFGYRTTLQPTEPQHPGRKLTF